MNTRIWVKTVPGTALGYRDGYRPPRQALFCLVNRPFDGTGTVPEPVPRTTGTVFPSKEGTGPGTTSEQWFTDAVGMPPCEWVFLPDDRPWMAGFSAWGPRFPVRAWDWSTGSRADYFWAEDGQKTARFPWSAGCRMTWCQEVWA